MYIPFNDERPHPWGGARKHNLYKYTYAGRSQGAEVALCCWNAVERLDAIVQAELMDLDADLQEIVELVPPGAYDRQRLCDQINSALAAHGWGGTYGTVE